MRPALPGPPEHKWFVLVAVAAFTSNFMSIKSHLSSSLSYRFISSLLQSGGKRTFHDLCGRQYNSHRSKHLGISRPTNSIELRPPSVCASPISLPSATSRLEVTGETLLSTVEWRCDAFRDVTDRYTGLERDRRTDRQTDRWTEGPSGIDRQQIRWKDR